MAIELPKNRLPLRQINIPKRNIPLEQIIAVQGQNPLATGIETAGNVIGQAIAKRAELRRQGEEIAQLARMTGQDIPAGMTGLTPETYIKGLTAKSELEKAKAAVEKSRQGPSESFIGQGVDAQGNLIVLGNKSATLRTIRAPGGEPLLPKSSTMPTSGTRASAEFANTIIPHIQEMRNLINEADAKGYIGPAAGRAYNQFMAGKIGSTGEPDADRLLGQLRATDSLLKSGTMRVHFGSRGGTNMYDHFSDILNSGKQSAALLNGSLDGIESFMTGYANAGTKRGAALQPLPATAPITATNKNTGQKIISTDGGKTWQPAR